MFQTALNWKSRIAFICVCAFLLLTLSGCFQKAKTTRQVLEAAYTKDPILVDGQLDEAVWKNSKGYQMNLSKDKIKSGTLLQESRQVRFAWDEEYFYLAAEFEESDIVAQGKKNEIHHYQYGDLCELFLKPAARRYYWELYVTPAGKKSSFFYPAKGYLGLPGCLEDYDSGLNVAARCDGTLNKWQDKDNGWTAEMAMPVKDLEAFGDKFDPTQDWLILIGRYNYSVYMESVELSMTAQTSATNFHLLEEYAELKLVK